MPFKSSQDFLNTPRRGGPGVGPICVAEHLKDFLPSNPIISSGGKYHIDAISSAPWGSALVCLISYGYIRMLGKLGIKNSTEMAIVNANYMKTKLERTSKSYIVVRMVDLLTSL